MLCTVGVCHAQVCWIVLWSRCVWAYFLRRESDIAPTRIAATATIQHMLAKIASTNTTSSVISYPLLMSGKRL
jgi:hypothetical protein